MSATEPFNLSGKTAVIIGGAGLLAGALADCLGKAGARLAVVAPRRARETAAGLAARGLQAEAFTGDALQAGSLRECLAGILKRFGRVDVLVNAAGGNRGEATTSQDLPFFDLPADALEKVVDLNLFGGAILPCQVFAKEMVKNPEGASIINICSINAFRPLTRIPGYSAAKAAVANFTQWLAVHLAREYNPKLRVNAIAPGFFLTEQNRFLLTQADGGLTERGKAILAHTPMGRFGDPEDLKGACLWLASDASRFVTGTVIPVDGGFNAFAGV